MVGYPEALTDPSYRGQILVLTYPMVSRTPRLLLSPAHTTVHTTNLPTFIPTTHSPNAPPPQLPQSHTHSPNSPSFPLLNPSH